MAGVILFLFNATRSPNCQIARKAVHFQTDAKGLEVPVNFHGLVGHLKEWWLGGAMEGNQGRFWGAWIGNSLIGWIELDKVWEDDVVRVIADISII